MKVAGICERLGFLSADHECHLGSSLRHQLRARAVGHPGPTGSVFDEDVGNEELYQIPDSTLATVVSTQAGSPFPAVDAIGTPVPISNLDSSSWRIVVDTLVLEVLRLRLTDVPGWHASLDGHPLQLDPFDRSHVASARSGGRHVIELRYWPTTFSLGLVLAAISAVALALSLVTSMIRARVRRQSNDRLE